MAYNWNWDKKMGEIFHDKWHYNLYEGNGVMIAIDEWKDENDGKDKYRVAWFLCDKTHMKDCLGLTKGHDDMFEGNVDKLIIYKDRSQYWKDIVDAFTKAEPNIVIEIYPTEPKNGVA